MSIKGLQIARNAESRDGWERFAPHRARVTKLLAGAADSSSSSLCIFGAGNCNDLDLRTLLDQFAHIDLVDIDSAALSAGVAQQSVDIGRIRQHGNLDVTGIGEELSGWDLASPPTDPALDECLAKALRATLDFADQPFQVTASVCVLSQIVESLAMTLGEAHPRFLDMLAAVRLRHLQLLLGLTRPGGTGFLISDVVSSVTCPEILAVGDHELPQVVGQAIAARNFFTGVNPFVLKALFASDANLAPHVQKVQLSNPWLWDLGPRTYAVCAIRVQKQ